MPEFGGLQIEVQCVKCGNLPSPTLTLFEMKNHTFICVDCRQKEEQRGKHINWRDTTLTPSQALPVTESMTGSSRQLRTRSLAPTTATLPSDSIFSLLDMPLDASIPALQEGIKQKMTALTRQSDSPEKKHTIAMLRDWRGKLQEEEQFEAYRNSLKPATPQGSRLSVGGQAVLTAQEFLAACEANAAGWEDGERYLRTGVLQQWILFQLDDRSMAIEARNFQRWRNVSDFRALNTMLYCLIPERPFRLYTGEHWQPLERLPSAATPEELAQLCDMQWLVGEQHLHNGAMLYWLEHSCGVKGLSEYYNTSLAPYATTNRGLGLELLLEKAIPGLVRPQLKVTFDGELEACTIPQQKDKRWDRERQHYPIVLKITNVTRGFVSLDIAADFGTSSNEVEWLFLQERTVNGRPGAGFPVEERLVLTHLEKLHQGQTCHHKLQLIRRREANLPPLNETYPVKLKIMYFYQGLHGQLWLSGLRGNLTGLFWSGLVGLLLGLLWTWLIPLLFSTVSGWSGSVGNATSFQTIVQDVLDGTLQTLRLQVPQLPGSLFLLLAIGIPALVGFFVGIGRGHADYSEKQGASRFVRSSFWLSALAALLLLFLNGGIEAVSLIVQGSSGSFIGMFALQSIGGALITALLIFIIACIIARIRSRLETYLRTRYSSILLSGGKV